MGASDRRKLWICRFAWTTQTRCPHTHSSDRKKRRKRLEDSFEEEENRNGRRLYTLISTVPGPSDGVHLNLLTHYGGARRHYVNRQSKILKETAMHRNVHVAAATAFLLLTSFG